MSTKKTKFDKAEPFFLQVCNAIRFHVGRQKELEGERAEAFDARDAALAELREIEARRSDGDDDEPTLSADEIVELKAKHSDAVCKIEDLRSRISWHHKQVIDLVTKADTPGLDILYERPESPSEPVRAKEPAGDAGGVKPVGRPGKPRPIAPDPSLADGVDQHLATSINELDMPEKVKGLLINAGLLKVGNLIDIIDADKDIGAEANLSVKQAEDVKKAVAAFRRKHRKAAREAEREGQE